MVMPINLLGLGFISRIARLHGTIPVGIITRVGFAVSERTCAALRRLDKRWDGTVGRLLFYWPTLTISLTVRVMLDIWSSYIFEAN
ncbi:hypothetical protein GQ43DRAFT_315347 [Delitschia confertaspora ATCC 74209]|uniref:Uncharacterized protein n=1 Tax=Delitschia confertaspora ATCC 74209 TaxID=1513339 RepID=A0A9P4JTJ8_9PLEO|nr:hypothetical protein GQ43DRAFT_315347 [Delitschia confertaspora ATCC 74209]